MRRNQREPTDALPFLPTVSIGLLSFIPGLFFFCLFLSGRADREGKELRDHLASTALVGLLIYKFWPLVESPLSILNVPALVLICSGGAWAAEAAFAGAAAWFILKAGRKAIPGWPRTTRLLLTGWILVRI